MAPELLCSATKISRLETRRPHRVAWVTKGSDHHVLEVPTQARRHTETSGLRLTEAHAEAAAAMGLILLDSCLTGVVVNSVAGPAAAIGTGMAVAVGLDRMLA